MASNKWSLLWPSTTQHVPVERATRRRAAKLTTAGICLLAPTGVPLPRHLIADGTNHRLQRKAYGCPTTLRPFDDGCRDGCRAVWALTLSVSEGNYFLIA